MRLRRVFSVSFLAQGAIFIIGFVNSIIITRNLGVEGRGLYALSMNIVLILSLILGDGLYRSNTYYISVDRKKFNTLFTNATIAVALIGVVLVLLPFAVSDSIVAIIVPGLNPTLILLAILSVIPLIYTRNIEGLLLGLQRYYAYNSLLVAPLLLYLMFNVVLLFFKLFTPEQVITNYLVAWLIVTAVIVNWLVITQQIKFTPNWKVFVDSFITGMKASVSHICLFLLFRVDIFLINYFLGVDQAGIYSVAVLVSELLQKLANTSGSIIFPKLAGKQNHANRKLSINVLMFVMGIGLVFSIAVLLFGRTAIVWLYKKEFAEAAIPLFFLLPGTVMMACGKILLFSLWGQNFPRITVIVPLISFFMNTILNLFFIQIWGINGAAISTSISYCFFGIVLGIYYFRQKVPTDVNAVMGANGLE
ncbi:oligosaccharide flippase family protein [candidate division KSB1 bacterium]|nr:oligosaccharide flippase family protein [candidate division KSB1 bacterium]